MKKPEKLDSYITFDEIEQIGFDYTQNPFPWIKEKRDHKSEQYFKLRDGVHLLCLNIHDGERNCIIYCLHDNKEDSCHIRFHGKIMFIHELRQVLLLCGIPYSRGEWFN